MVHLFTQSRKITSKDLFVFSVSVVMAVTIENLEKLLNLKIVEQKITYLTTPGENYGSLMLKLDLVVETQDGLEEMNLVAKMPPRNVLIQNMFNTQVTFRNEIGFYRSVFPLLQDLQREEGVLKVVNFVPKYYGSRFNLNENPSGKIDSHAVLLLQNMKVQNYVVADRTEGVGIDVAKLVLLDFAHLHAVAIALKLKKPKVFDSQVRPYLRRLELTDDFKQSTRRSLFKLLKTVKEVEPLLDRVLAVSFTELFPVDTPREPFATINHNDCWTNNTMQLIVNQKVVKNILVDFQLCDYGSPVKDVLFFLFTSVKMDVLEKYCDDLIGYYYKSFVSVLEDLRVETQEFSWNAFEKELRYEARNSQFAHILLMLFPIFAPKGSVTNFDDVKPEDIGASEPTEELKQRFIFVVKEFAKRGWI